MWHQMSHMLSRCCTCSNLVLTLKYSIEVLFYYLLLLWCGMYGVVSLVVFKVYTHEDLSQGSTKILRSTSVPRMMMAQLEVSDMKTADGLNKMIERVWPYFVNYLEDKLKYLWVPELLRCTHFPSCKLSSVKVGPQPPRVLGMKVYDSTCKDEIIIDVDVGYEGYLNFECILCAFEIKLLKGVVRLNVNTSESEEVKKCIIRLGVKIFTIGKSCETVYELDLQDVITRKHIKVEEGADVTQSCGLLKVWVKSVRRVKREQNLYVWLQVGKKERTTGVRTLYQHDQEREYVFREGFDFLIVDPGTQKLAIKEPEMRTREKKIYFKESKSVIVLNLSLWSFKPVHIPAGEESNIRHNENPDWGEPFLSPSVSCVTQPQNTFSTNTGSQSSTTSVVENNPASVENSPPSVENSPPSVENSPPSVENNPASVENSPPSVENSPPSVENSPPSVENSPPSVENNPPSVENSPPSVENGPPSVENSPSIVQNSPSCSTAEVGVEDTECVTLADQIDGAGKATKEPGSTVWKVHLYPQQDKDTKQKVKCLSDNKMQFECDIPLDKLPSYILTISLKKSKAIFKCSLGQVRIRIASIKTNEVYIQWYNLEKPNDDGTVHLIETPVLLDRREN
ncbi:Nitric oxide synthase-like [Homarus americanus]|uniref:Nitric oxide synthase-like n=1 Tax=Homarus americanus TaxID=6706 RepID=A0A8J5K5Q8_HOMAM|nr:Nitric oxide synthase-like [Homarus americanus]